MIKSNKNILKSSTEVFLEDKSNTNALNNAYSLFQFGTYNSLSDIESTLRSLAVTYAVRIALGLIVSPFAIPSGLTPTIVAVGY